MAELQTPEAHDPRARLMLAAEELFASQGFDGTTVRHICERAGMNIAAINYHFGDKEKLYVEVVRNAHCGGMNSMPMPEWTPRTPPAEKLRQFIRFMLMQMNAPIRPTALQLVMRELTSPTLAAHTVVEDFIRPMAIGLRGIMHELIPDMPEKQRIMTCLSIVGQILYYRQNRAVTQMLFGEPMVNELDTETIIEHITRFTFAALGLAKSYPKVVEKEGAR